MKEDPQGVDVETITKLLNIGKRYFYELKLMTGTPPDVSRGRYDASRWALWYMRFLSAELERRGEPGGPESVEMQAARLKLISAQVERVEIDNAVARGELVERDDVSDALSRMLTNCKMRLRAIPSSLGPQLVNKTGAYCRDRLADAIDQALTELDGEPSGRPS